MDQPHEDHRSRMKEKVWKHGADTLLDHELLEMLLYYVIPRKNTNPIAHDLINRFGNLYGVFSASPRDLMQVAGIGEKSALLFLLLTETIGRYERGQLGKKIQLNTLNKAGIYCKSLFVGKKYEEFHVLYLDLKGYLIHAIRFSIGDVNRVMVYPKRIVEEAIHGGASAVLLTHNHPGGIPEPSDEDCTLTDSISRALATVNVALNDHIIVGADDYCSFKQEGWMEEVFNNPEYGLAQRAFNFKNPPKNIE